MRREILAARLRTQGREHQATNSARSSVAQNLLNQGSPAQLAEAERLFLENLVISQRVHGARARFTNADRANLGNLYDEEAPGRSGGNVARGADRPPRIARTEAPGDGERDRIARLRPASRTEVPRHRTDPSPTGGDPRREIAAAVASGVARNLLGASLAGQRRFAEAEPLVVGRYEQMVAQRASMAAYFNGFLTGSGQRVVDLYARGVSPRRPRSGGRSSPRADARSA